MATRKIGSTFWLTNETKLEVVEVEESFLNMPSCEGCYFQFHAESCNSHIPKLGPCCKYGREDRKWVIFKKV